MNKLVTTFSKEIEVLLRIHGEFNCNVFQNRMIYEHIQQKKTNSSLMGTLAQILNEEKPERILYISNKFAN